MPGSSSVEVHGPTGGPFFNFEDGQLLTRERFVSEVRKALTEMGHNYALHAGHSFRIGAASLRHWGGGRTQHIQCTSGHPQRSFVG